MNAVVFGVFFPAGNRNLRTAAELFYNYLIRIIIIMYQVLKITNVLQLET